MLYEALNHNHDHPKDTSFSIEDYSEFSLDFKLKTMVVVTNSGQQFFMTKTEDYDRAGAVKALIKITVEADKNKDGKLSCQRQNIRIL